MKEIKAFIHRNRITDVIHTLKAAGFNKLCVADVKGTLKALDNKEQNYSVELGTAIITEMNLELVCDESRLDEATQLIQKNARTGQADAGGFMSSISTKRLGLKSKMEWEETN